MQTEATTTLALGGDLTVNRLGYGAMRITGPGIWGEPKDRNEARKVLQRALELGVNFIDTADAYGPEVSERHHRGSSVSLQEGSGDCDQGRLHALRP